MVVSGKELSGYAHTAGFISLDIQEEHIFLLDTIHRIEGAPVHKDPFDRLLICQAKAEHMILVTADENIVKYDVQVYWSPDDSD